MSVGADVFQSWSSSLLDLLVKILLLFPWLVRVVSVLSRCREIFPSAPSVRHLFSPEALTLYPTRFVQSCRSFGVDLSRAQASRIIHLYSFITHTNVFIFPSCFLPDAHRRAFDMSSHLISQKVCSRSFPSRLAESFEILADSFEILADLKYSCQTARCFVVLFSLRDGYFLKLIFPT